MFVCFTRTYVYLQSSVLFGDMDINNNLVSISFHIL